jgi:hypothetical protein
MIGWILIDVMAKTTLCQENSVLGKVKRFLVSDNILRCDLLA